MKNEIAFFTDVILKERAFNITIELLATFSSKAETDLTNKPLCSLILTVIKTKITTLQIIIKFLLKHEINFLSVCWI